MLSPDLARRMAQDLVERGTKAGADAADALYVADRSSSVQVRLGELEQVDSSEGERMALRLFVGRRSVSVASSDFSDESLRTLVERGMAMAAQAPEDPYAGLAPDALLHTGPDAAIDSIDNAELDATEPRRIEVATQLARLSGGTVLLKGTPTVISDPDGGRLVVASGTQVLATGGSGDALGGIVATLLAQGCTPSAAAACAAWVHGRAAELTPGVRGYRLTDASALRHPR